MSTITAIYENGVFRPLQPVEGVDDGTRVEVALPPKKTALDILAPYIGMISKEDLAIIDAAVEEAFEQVDPDEWE